MKTNVLIIFGLMIFGFLANFCAAYSYYDSGYATSAYYGTIFDERGLANIALRLDYVNTQAADVNHIDMNIPGTEVKLVSAFVETTCTPVNVKKSDQYAYSYTYSANTNTYTYDPSCPSGKLFVAAEVEKLNSGSYRIKLNKTLAQGESAHVIVFYRAFGYTEDSLVGKKFNFETVKFDFDVETTRVSIGVDDELHLKEGDSSGRYREAQRTILNTVSASGASYDSVASNTEMQYAISGSYNYLSYAPGYVREKSVLLAGETFRVGGEYSKVELFLYIPEIIAVLAALVVAGFFISKKIKKVKEAAKEAKSVESKNQYNANRNVRSVSTELNPKKAMEDAENSGSRGTIVDAAIFAFMVAVGFALLVSFVVFALIIGRSNLEGSLLAVMGLVVWMGTAIWTYVQKVGEGYGTMAALMFVGFSVIVTPFMVLLTAFIAAMMSAHTYPYYYGGVL